MTTIRLLSAGLVATAMLIAPAMARQHHVTPRHQTLGDFTRPTISGSAGFHATRQRGIFAKEVNDLLAPQLTSDDDLVPHYPRYTWNTFLARSTPLLLT